jgi:hypothetical protein
MNPAFARHSGAGRNPVTAPLMYEHGWSLSTMDSGLRRNDGKKSWSIERA